MESNIPETEKIIFSIQSPLSWKKGRIYPLVRDTLCLVQFLLRRIHILYGTLLGLTTFVSPKSFCVLIKRTTPFSCFAMPVIQADVLCVLICGGGAIPTGNICSLTQKDRFFQSISTAADPLTISFMSKYFLLQF